MGPLCRATPYSPRLADSTSTSALHEGDLRRPCWPLTSPQRTHSQPPFSGPAVRPPAAAPAATHTTPPPACHSLGYRPRSSLGPTPAQSDTWSPAACILPAAPLRSCLIGSRPRLLGPKGQVREVPPDFGLIVPWLFSFHRLHKSICIYPGRHFQLKVRTQYAKGPIRSNQSPRPQSPRGAPYRHIMTHNPPSPAITARPPPPPRQTHATTAPTTTQPPSSPPSFTPCFIPTATLAAIRSPRGCARG